MYTLRPVPLPRPRFALRVASLTIRQVPRSAPRCGVQLCPPRCPNAFLSRPAPSRSILRVGEVQDAKICPQSHGMSHFCVSTTGADIFFAADARASVYPVSLTRRADEVCVSGPLTRASAGPKSGGRRRSLQFPSFLRQNSIPTRVASSHTHHDRAEPGNRALARFTVSV